MRVSCSQETLRYNSYHITAAFFPKEEIQSCLEPEQKASVIVTDDDGKILAEAFGNSKKETEHELFRALSQLTGRTLPWGTLTGVRPVKLASSRLNEGMSEEDYIAWAYKERLVSPEKAALSYRIARKEKMIIEKALAKAADQSYSLYIGIPFCESICSYCSFSSGSISDWAGSVDPYLDALISELKEKSAACSKMRLGTIYIGGGTPTSLTASRLERLLDAVCEYFPADKALEFTLEAGRPDSITKEKLRAAKDHAVTRISINPQSMQQKTLDIIGRRHSVKDVYDAFALARAAGFDDINMDIITSLPGESLEDIKDTLRQIETLSPENLTVHSLAIKRSAALKRQEADPALALAMTEEAHSAAGRMGLEAYYLYRQKGIAGNLENAGFARPGFEGIYNVLIMEEVQTIIACGAGAKSKIILSDPVPDPRRPGKMTAVIRKANAKAIDEYIRRSVL